MKLKNTILASAIISLTSLSIQAATELTPEQASALQPYDSIVVTGRFDSIGDAVSAISRRADNIGAASFYIQSTNEAGHSGNWRVVAAVYKADAPKAEEKKYRVIDGVTELPKERAYRLQPFDTVTVQGLYSSQPDVNQAIAKAAKAKGAAAFFIVRQIDANRGGNQHITAYIYKADAKERVVQSPNAIPADSDAAKALLAEGGEAAQKVEIPGVASSEAPSSDIGRFFETQSSKGGRYTVTLPDGTKIEELNKITAAQMVPFDSIKFSGNYSSMTDVSYQTAKRAAKKGAKYYHITRQWQGNGSNMTISADLYK